MTTGGKDIILGGCLMFELFIVTFISQWEVGVGFRPLVTPLDKR